MGHRLRFRGGVGGVGLGLGEGLVGRRLRFRGRVGGTLV